MTELREVYEPEALVARLTVGTRVKVRISPETVMSCGCIIAPEGQTATGVIVGVLERAVTTRCSGCGAMGIARGARFKVDLEDWDVVHVALPAIALTPIEEEQRE